MNCRDFCTQPTEVNIYNQIRIWIQHRNVLSKRIYERSNKIKLWPSRIIIKASHVRRLSDIARQFVVACFFSLPHSHFFSAAAAAATAELPYDWISFKYRDLCLHAFHLFPTFFWWWWWFCFFSLCGRVVSRFALFGCCCCCHCFHTSLSVCVCAFFYVMYFLLFSIEFKCILECCSCHYDPMGSTKTTMTAEKDTT